MNHLILFDTDILIDAGRGVNKAVTYMQETEQRSMIGISVITRMELIVGCRNKKELQILERFLQRFEIVSLNEEIADTALSLLKRYRLSHGLLIPDALIAATAVIAEAPLVTKNQRDYQFIKGLQLVPY